MAALGTLSLGAHAEGAHTRHLHAEIQGGEAQMVGTPAATQVMNLDIVLPVRDQAGLKLAAAIYDPASAHFRHFLTPQSSPRASDRPRRTTTRCCSFARSERLGGDRRQPRRHGRAGARHA